MQIQLVLVENISIILSFLMSIQCFPGAFLCSDVVGGGLTVILGVAVINSHTFLTQQEWCHMSEFCKVIINTFQLVLPFIETRML